MRASLEELLVTVCALTSWVRVFRPGHGQALDAPRLTMSNIALLNSKMTITCEDSRSFHFLALFTDVDNVNPPSAPHTGQIASNLAHFREYKAGLKMTALGNRVSVPSLYEAKVLAVNYARVTCADTNRYMCQATTYRNDNTESRVEKLTVIDYSKDPYIDQPPKCTVHTSVCSRCRHYEEATLVRYVGDRLELSCTKAMTFGQGLSNQFLWYIQRQDGYWLRMKDGITGQRPRSPNSSRKFIIDETNIGTCPDTETKTSTLTYIVTEDDPDRLQIKCVAEIEYGNKKYRKKANFTLCKLRKRDIIEIGGKSGDRLQLIDGKRTTVMVFDDTYTIINTTVTWRIAGENLGIGSTSIEITPERAWAGNNMTCSYEHWGGLASTTLSRIVEVMVHRDINVNDKRRDGEYIHFNEGEASKISVIDSFFEIFNVTCTRTNSAWSLTTAPYIATAVRSWSGEYFSCSYDTLDNGTYTIRKEIRVHVLTHITRDGEHVDDHQLILVEGKHAVMSLLYTGTNTPAVNVTWSRPNSTWTAEGSTIVVTAHRSWDRDKLTYSYRDIEDSSEKFIVLQIYYLSSVSIHTTVTEVICSVTPGYPDDVIKHIYNERMDDTGTRTILMIKAKFAEKMENGLEIYSAERSEQDSNKYVCKAHTIDVNGYYVGTSYACVPSKPDQWKRQIYIKKRQQYVDETLYLDNREPTPVRIVYGEDDVMDFTYVSWNMSNSTWTAYTTSLVLESDESWEGRILTCSYVSMCNVHGTITAVISVFDRPPSVSIEYKGDEINCVSTSRYPAEIKMDIYKVKGPHHADIVKLTTENITTSKGLVNATTSLGLFPGYIAYDTQNLGYICHAQRRRNGKHIIGAVACFPKQLFFNDIFDGDDENYYTCGNIQHSIAGKVPGDGEGYANVISIVIGIAGLGVTIFIIVAATMAIRKFCLRPPPMTTVEMTSQRQHTDSPPIEDEATTPT